ncbi:MAG: dephospho-CoA kinase [Lachnospiraceae bacterium]|nr:dephospho-CoA kinase [Lachnospiraceae bacterium]
MQVIGITGGVGCGKSVLLSELEKRYDNQVLVLRADTIANEVKEPGGLCYNKIVSVLGEGVVRSDGAIDRRRMAERIFTDDALLQEVNAILHPAVREVVKNTIRELREKEAALPNASSPDEGDDVPGVTEGAGETVPRVVFIEAALLIEENYKEDILDELWVVHAPESVRRKRLKESRGYTDAKIDAIMAQQQTEEGFLAHADQVIHNGGALEDAVRQTGELLKRYGIA